MGLFSDVLLTVDYDRTLTDTNAVVPQRNLEAIRYFMDNGGTFTVNSGRSLPMARCFRDVVPVNAPLLLYNGSAWYDTREEKLMNALLIDLDPVTAVYDLQARFPELTIEIQGLHHHHIFKKNPIWEDYNVNNGSSWEYTTPDQTGPFIKFAVYGYFLDDRPATMYQFTPHEEELFNEASAYIEEKWGDKLELFRACSRILDLHAKGCSKLRSARDLQAHLGKKILVCVGDAENDLTMLEGADYAFCPSDGIVAERFPNVCPCGDGAVADVIYEKIPEILKNEK
jgi:HAD superfamily hydrolase (TIGR01484 family)